MYLIDVPNLKEINHGKVIFVWFKNSSKQCKEEEKCEKKWAMFGSVYLFHH